MHTTPASSMCVQPLLLTPTPWHCSRDVSFPLHWRLSSMIGPLPAPNLPTIASSNFILWSHGVDYFSAACNNNAITCDLESHLSTGYKCFHPIPLIIAYSSPPSIHTNLHPSFPRISPSYQPNIIVVAFYTNIIINHEMWKFKPSCFIENNALIEFLLLQKIWMPLQQPGYLELILAAFLWICCDISGLSRVKTDVAMSSYHVLPLLTVHVAISMWLQGLRLSYNYVSYLIQGADRWLANSLGSAVGT